MAESSESSMFLEQEDGISVLHGSMKVDGNLEVDTQISTKELKVYGENFLPIVQIGGSDTISFKKACEFTAPVQFNHGRTLIGIETTYHSAYVGSETLQAGQRIVVGDSLFKITADQRKIVADTFKMTLARLDVDNSFAKRSVADNAEAKTLKVTDEIIGKNIFADTIKTNKIFLDSIGSRCLSTSENMTTKDIDVQGTGTFEHDVRIKGRGVGANGAALTVDGGEIVANKGIVSHTRNNRFQCMQIMGSGTDHDVCFRIDKNVDSYIEGDVTLKDSKLILDGSRLVSDNVVVMPIADDGVSPDEPVSGVQLTTSTNWETYEEGMVNEIEMEEGSTQDGDYDAVESVEMARERNAANYERVQRQIKDIVNPISYLEQNSNPDIPKRFAVKSGVYRIDSNGNALVRNLVSEKARFSNLEAYRFKVGQLHVDTLVTTGVASNVVHADNLLKSEGLAEFDGVINSSADVFIEANSNVDIANGSNVVFQNGSTLKLRNGAKFEMGGNTDVKFGGSVEIDVSKLVFVDSTTGNKYRISFRNAQGCEGDGVVMEYSKVQDDGSEPRAATSEIDARELDKKLKTLGV